MLTTPQNTTAGRSPSRSNAATIAAAVLSAACLAVSANAAPNLVPNPSFESVSQCPSTLDVVTGEIHFAAPWKSAILSPDLFHSCTVVPSVSTPNNSRGFQWPYLSAAATTNLGGHAGFSLWTSDCPNCREYVQVPLGRSLTRDTQYRASFHVSLAESSGFAIDRIGARLSHLTVAHVPNVGVVLPMVPQVEHQGPPITELNDWVLITGKFHAEGNENNLIIGNFREDPELDLAYVGGANDNIAYYYLDGIALQEADIDDLKDPSGPNSNGMMTTTS